MNCLFFSTGPTEVRNLKWKARLYSIFLSWEIPKQLNGVLEYYTITYAVNKSHQVHQFTNITSFSIPNLTPNTLVSDITVSAITEVGEGPAVTVNNITTLDRPG